MLSIDVVARDSSVAASLADSNSDCNSETIIGPPPISSPLATPALATPSPRRSPRLKLLEPPGHMTILDKATARKNKRLAGFGSSTRAKQRSLPSDDLLHLASQAPSPLPRTDVIQLAALCDVSATQIDEAMLSV